MRSCPYLHPPIFRWLSSSTLVLLLAFTMGVTAANAQTSGDTPDGYEVPSGGVVSAGVQVRVAPTAFPIEPTAEQMKLLMSSLDQEAPPAMPIYKGFLPPPAGEPTLVPGQELFSAGAGPEAGPADFTIFRSSLLPTLGTKSGIGEPSIDGSGKMAFLTGNWYAARSTNNGGTWGYINPFANYGFGTTFCCDQLTVYDSGHDRQLWLRQYTDHLEISSSAGKDLAHWCTYAWRPGNFGLPTSDSFDFNHMALSTRFLYVSTNVYGSGGFVGALVFRIPLQEQAACAGLSYSYFGPRNTEFSNAFVNGAGDTMYWGSNAVSGGLTSGSGFRVFQWADDGNGVSWFDRAITPFSYMATNAAQNNCGSASGAVQNWCQRSDSRMTGNGYISFPSLAQTVNGATSGPANDAVIGFAFNAGSDASHPRPYIRRIYFRSTDMTYLGRAEIWNADAAFLYPDMAPNAQGHVGIVWAWGGGSGTTNYYPGYGFTIDDDVSQAQPWSSSFVFGAGNACLNSGDNFRRWGDYLSIHALSPAKLAWIAAGFRMSSATNCSTGSSAPQVEVKTFIFGRGRDTPAYTRGTTY
jgi:hypothetical protein